MALTLASSRYNLIILGLVSWMVKEGARTSLHPYHCAYKPNYPHIKTQPFQSRPQIVYQRGSPPKQKLIPSVEIPN